LSTERPTVLITDYAWPSIETERAILEAAGADVLVAETGAEEELVRLAPEADAIMTCWQPVPVSVLDAAPRCRIVARYGIGLDNIAVAHATQLGILVTNVPDFCLEEVADHALALLLASARKVVSFSRVTRAGGWDRRGSLRCGPFRCHGPVKRAGRPVGHPPR
jgi:D-3-phosphoglycerate dehydrogenase